MNTATTDNLLPAHYERKMAGGDLAKFCQRLPRPLVFTNGCFDILHRGHIDYLDQARQLGESLIVAVNSDASVKRQNKGEDRPINPLEDRMALLASLESVDAVVVFDDDTPLAVITEIKPDILVKGGDWAVEQIVGADLVVANGGQVVSMAFRYQRSTTSLLERIRS
ncbi:MAG: D-glycero-beta-D-manno-heptose 1-phosphate adenylyltransferase [Immundisolibacteraceae bacterium]|nr:D-glycero-beta-D-manno-heptose 1-phosphate adenylyltransferase [Immundisolibacteraceae bacterium]